MKYFVINVIVVITVLCLPDFSISQNLGKFTGFSDVGNIVVKGETNFSEDSSEYIITASGANIWGTYDEFSFLHKKMFGDIYLAADIRFVGEGKNPNRKAGLMIRQSTDPDSPYADAMLHGDGLISLQYREVKGGDTKEVTYPVYKSGRLIFERTGEQFTLTIQNSDGDLIPVGTISLSMGDTVLTGLAVCSHESEITETAFFSTVNMKQSQNIGGDDRMVESTLEILNIETLERKIVYRVNEHFEAPNWSHDGEYLIYNMDGKLYSIPVKGGKPKLINTGFASSCNNDHGISPDGKQLVISNWTDDKSLIYKLPIEGGEPKLVTQNGSSYWHGWSPDGKTLAYCAERNRQYDVYSISVDGGEETQLTNEPGLDDGPDYSPDGKYIYFNSVRTGVMKIWRMNTDGTEQEQVTFNEEYADWFPHPSPDGKKIVFLSFDKSVEGHPANKNVVLRMIEDGKEPEVAAHLFGGQGTINVPTWSPDSKYFAFVSYRLVAGNNSIN